MNKLEVLREEKELVRQALGGSFDDRDFFILRKKDVRVVVSKCRRGRCCECWGEINNDGIIAEINYDKGLTAYSYFRFHRNHFLG